MYIYRIIALTGLSLQETNWRPLIFVALMVSQKIWDDSFLSNGDFSSIYPFFDKEQLNLLEIKFLEIIQYNVFVTLSNYMTFYLNLKALVQNQVDLKPLSKYSLQKMEHLIMVNGWMICFLDVGLKYGKIIRNMKVNIIMELKMVLAHI